jgi:putative Mg2+ transporter-C (MgtC) family protein
LGGFANKFLTELVGWLHFLIKSRPRIQQAEGFSMSYTLEWSDIAIRLALTVAAAALIGINRSEHGKEAGLRTILLVGLAAAVAMILANSLLVTKGKTADSFIQMDPMRLPLGILTGMGFIGGGAILRKDDMVLGVTTAATLWAVTVIGLCLGAGQIALGLIALVLVTAALWTLKPLESLLPRDRRATLFVSLTTDAIPDEQIRTAIHGAGYAIASWGVVYANERQARRRTLRCEIRWRGKHLECHPPPFLEGLALRPEVRRLRWVPGSEA